jgi:hypothetical protein
MTTTINAVSGTGLTQTSDGSGIVKLQSNGVATNALAWVQFAGASGTIASSYNVSSVTRTGTGQFTVNFSSALTDNKYTVTGSCAGGNNTGGTMVCNYQGVPTTSLCYVSTYSFTPALVDYAYSSVQIFGN